MKKVLIFLFVCSVVLSFTGCGGGGGGSTDSTSNTPHSGDGGTSSPGVVVSVQESAISNTQAINPPMLPSTGENIPTTNLLN